MQLNGIIVGHKATNGHSVAAEYIETVECGGGWQYCLCCNINLMNGQGSGHAGADNVSCALRWAFAGEYANTDFYQKTICKERCSTCNGRALELVLRALAMGGFPPGCLWECVSKCSGQARRPIFVFCYTLTKNKYWAPCLTRALRNTFPKASWWETPHGQGSE